MSIFLSNFVQVTQGPRNKAVPPLLQDVIVLMQGNGYDVTISYRQIIIWVVTAVLLEAFWYLVSQDLARPRATRLRAGPEDGGAGRRRCRPHHLDHLRASARRSPPSPAPCT
jgi:hypothetical protein